MRLLKAIYVIWLRDVLRFARERSRIVGMLGQPLLYLLVVGTGLSATFRLSQAPANFNYVMFMYPGIIGMSVLFTSVFSGISVVWDREFGFLKEVLVAPVPRWAVAVGKVLGGSTVAMLQGTVILLLAPVVGLSLSLGTFAKVLLVMFIISFSLTSLGITIASRMESMEGFQMIMNFLIMPLFFLSGALFPLEGVPVWMKTLMRFDPLTYGIDALRNIIYAGSPFQESFTYFPLEVDLAVVMVAASLFILVGSRAFNRQD